MFIGGEVVRGKIEDFTQQYQIFDIITLPYVPLGEAQYNLSASDARLPDDGVVFIEHCPTKILDA